MAQERQVRPGAPVSVSVSFTPVRRGPAAAVPRSTARSETVTNRAERSPTDLESVLGATPREFESRILRPRTRQDAGRPAPADAASGGCRLSSAAGGCAGPLGRDQAGHTGGHQPVRRGLAVRAADVAGRPRRADQRPVALPRHIDWGPPYIYELADESDTVVMYERVIREAQSPDDLAAFLDATTLRGSGQD